MNSTSTGMLALGLYALYGMLAFGLRSIVQLRRTGSAGFRGLSGRAGSTEWWGGVLFVAAVAGMVAGCAFASTGTLRPLSPLDRGAMRMAGMVLFGTGFIATLVAQFAMGDSWRIGVDCGERTKLVTSGPFRIVRNPIFSAMLTTVWGSALMVPNAVVLGAAVVLWMAVEIQVRLVEEPYLRQVHSGDYLAYAARTGRFFPGIGRLREARAR